MEKDFAIFLQNKDCSALLLEEKSYILFMVPLEKFGGLKYAEPPRGRRRGRMGRGRRKVVKVVGKKKGKRGKKGKGTKEK